MQMAREYQSAASLIQTELSADLRSGGAAWAEGPSNTRRHPDRFDSRQGKGYIAARYAYRSAFHRALPALTCRSPAIRIAIDRTYFGMKLKAAGSYSSSLAALIGPVSAGLFLG